MKKLLRNYRSNYDGVLNGKRSTYLSDVDQLAALQLSILFTYKKLHIDKLPSTIELLKLKKRITERKLDGGMCTLDSPGLSRLCSIDVVYEAYMEFKMQCNMIDRADVVVYLKVKEEENGIVDSKFPNTPVNDVITPIQKSPVSHSRILLQRILIGYLQLLVNTRDEIALARVIDAPSRGIKHQAFTDIRKLASEKQMPMFQVVSSFVRQINLGGKGYAPGEHHVLFQHKQGLCDFLVLMDKLQTEVDDAKNLTSAISNILKLLKTSFIRTLTPIFACKVVVTAVRELMEKYKRFSALSSTVPFKEIIYGLQGFLDHISCSDVDTGFTEDSPLLTGILSTPHYSPAASFKKFTTLSTQFNAVYKMAQEVGLEVLRLPLKENSPVSVCGKIVIFGVGKTPDVNNETPRKSFKFISTCEPVVMNETRNTSNDLITTDFSPPPATIPAANSALSLIRCHDSKKYKNQMKLLDNKESFELVIQENNEPVKMRKKRATVNCKLKSKVSKRLKLDTGQKTLTQFYDSGK